MMKNGNAVEEFSLDLELPEDFAEEEFDVSPLPKTFDCESVFVLTDLVSGRTDEIPTDLPIVREEGEELFLELEKRAFAQGLVRIEWNEKGLIEWDDENESFAPVAGKEIDFRIECLKREKKIVIEKKELG